MSGISSVRNSGVPENAKKAGDGDDELKVIFFKKYTFIFTTYLNFLPFAKRTKSLLGSF